jgi:hypothetical protein
VQQILLTVLDSTLFTFSIRLATLAFRKDHSYLEKWLTEKLGAQSETFLEVLHVTFPTHYMLTLHILILLVRLMICVLTPVHPGMC